MPTKQTVPTTAAEARIYAEQLAEQERDLADRRRSARQAAEVAACRELLDAEADELAEAANLALAEWKAAVDDDSIGLPQLFELWCNLRHASAVRATHVSQASATWDALEPIRHGLSSQPTTHRLDTHDSLDPRGEMAWARAVEDVIQHRVSKSRVAVESKVRDRIQGAGRDAAAAVK